MAKQKEFVRCQICEKPSTAIHWHHTIPRAQGGEQSLQIPLDGNCHTVLHSKADAVVSYRKGNRAEPPGRYWDNIADERRAEPWLNVLVAALLNPLVSEEDKLISLPSIKVDRETRAALNILMQETPGITNLNQLLEYCVQFTLQEREVSDVCRTTNNKNSKRSPTNRGKTPMW